MTRIFAPNFRNLSNIADYVCPILNGNLSIAHLLHQFIFNRIGTSLIFCLCNVVIFRDPSEGKIVEDFLVKEGVDESISMRILSIIKGMGKQLQRLLAIVRWKVYLLFITFSYLLTFSLPCASYASTQKFFCKPCQFHVLYVVAGILASFSW